MNGIIKQTTRDTLRARQLCHSVAGIMLSLQLWGVAGTQAADYRDALEPSSRLHPPRGNSEAFTARTTDQSKNAWGPPFAVAQKKLTRIVTTTADSGPGSLRQAISEAQNGDIVAFDPTLTNGGPATITLTGGPATITNDVTVQGLGPSVLAISGNNYTRVFEIGVEATVTIESLSVIQGGAFYPSLEQKGGGIGNFGVLNMRSVVVSDNLMRGDLYEDVRGGGIYNAGILVAESCAFNNNALFGDEISAFGGGVYNAGTFEAHDCVFENNRAVGSPEMTYMAFEGHGGGIYNVGSMLIQQCTFRANSAYGGCGLNYAGGVSGFGGAIAVAYNGSLIVNRSTFESNRVQGGCGNYDPYSPDVLPGGSGFGGAIYMAGAGSAMFSNCTFRANLALGGLGGSGGEDGSGFGGACYLVRNAEFDHVTIVSNSASEGGGVYSSGESSLPVLRRSLLSHNNASLSGHDISGSVESGGYNLILNTNGWVRSGDENGNIYNQDPLISVFGSYGGPTPTHLLLAGSPAIDAIPEDPATFDQRGASRPQGVAYDIGSVEMELGPVMEVLSATNDVIANGATANQGQGTDFGLLYVGQNRTNQFSVRNNGTLPVSILGVSTSGIGAASFLFSGMPSTVDAGSSAPFWVEFSPSTAEVYACTIDIVNDSTNTPFVLSLAGTGIDDQRDIQIVEGDVHHNINAESPFISFGNAQLGVDLILGALMEGGTVEIKTGDTLGSGGTIIMGRDLIYDGIGNLGAALMLDADGDIVINGAIKTTDPDANVLNLSMLSSGGSITQASEIQVRDLLFAVGPGGVMLAHASNEFASVGGTAHGNIQIVDGVGDIILGAGGLISSGNVEVVTAGALAMNGALQAGGDVFLDAQSGSIAGAGAVGANQLAALAVTDSITLNTDVAEGAFVAGGDVAIINAGDLIVAGQTIANNGSIDIKTAIGDLTVGSVGGTIPQAGMIADGSGSVTLLAGGTGSDVLMNDAVLSGSGDIGMTAADSVVTSAKIETDGRVDILSLGGTIAIGRAIDPSVVTLTAAGDIDVNAAVEADDSIALLAGTNGIGNVNVNATGSLETLAAGSDIRLTAGTTSGNINLAGNAWAVDTVVLSADAGGIMQSAGTVGADALSFTSGGDVILGTIAVSSVTGTSMGNIELGNTGPLDVLGLDSSGGNVDVATTLGLTASGLIASLGGDVDLSGESVLLNAGVNAGVGNASLTATGGSIGGLGLVRADTLTADAVTDIDLNTDVTTLDASVSGTGNISIDEADTINLVDVDTADGSITVMAGGQITATDLEAGGAGDIALTTTAGDVLVGDIRAAGDQITVASAGAIDESGADAGADLTAATLDMNAQTGIGSTAAIETAATAINADAADGNIDLDNVSASATTISSLTTGTGNILFSQAGGGALAVTVAVTGSGNIGGDVAGAGLAVWTVTAGGSGNVALAAAGDIDVGGSVEALDRISVTAGTDGTGSVNVNAGGSLETLAAGSDIVLSSGTTWADINLAGHVTAVDSVVLTADAGNIAQSAGTVAADSLAFSSGGSVTLANLAVSSATGTSMGDVALSNTGPLDVLGLDSGGGNVDVATTLGLTASGQIDSLGGDVDLSGESVLLNAGVNTGLGDASLTATGGSISGAGRVTADALVFNSDDAVMLNSLAVSTVTGESSFGGSIALVNTGALEILGLDSGGGDIDVTSDLALTIGGLVSSFGGNIALEGALLALNSAVDAGLGDIFLTATTGDIIGGGLVTADALTAVAVSGIDLNTSVSALDGSVSGTGGIQIDEADTIDLADLDTADGSITVMAGEGITAGAVTANGEISLSSGDSITIQRAGAPQNLGKVMVSGDVDVQLELTALPKAEHPFTGWLGDVPPGQANSNPVLITMDRSKVAVATFFTTFHVAATGGNDLNDGLSWVLAKQTIQSALDDAFAGDTVLVSNGIYGAISVPSDVDVIGVDGAQTTIIGSLPAGVRGVYLASNAALSGFTVTGAVVEVDGSGIYAESGAQIRRCIIRSNTTSQDGGGVYGGNLVNCLLVGNSAANGGGAANASLNHCTVAGNLGTVSGGGTKDCVLLNSIVQRNVPGDWIGGSATYSCALPLPAGAGNIDGDPAFVDMPNGNFRLAYESPCLGVASASGVIIDLAGSPRPQPRVYGGELAYDMGCYEYVPLARFVWTNGNAVVPYETWQNAANDIQTALDISSGGDRIVVEAGTYAPFTVSNAVVMLGYRGASNTVVDGGGILRPITITAPATLEGFTVQNGAAEDCGGVLADNGAVLRDIHIANSQATSPGGYGGGLCLYNGSKAEYLVVVSNQAQYGAGIYATATSEVHSSTIAWNTSGSGWGGGVYLEDAGTLVDSLVEGNSSARGGGVYAVDSEIATTTIRGNLASEYGGGVALFGGTLRNSWIEDNDSWNGAGIYASDALGHSCIVAGNIASSRGGGVHLNGTSAFYNLTIVTNQAAAGGGGVWINGGGRLWNSIAMFNSPSNLAPGSGDIQYSCIAPPPTGTGNFEAYPLFVATNDFHLRAGSPCVDAGTNEIWMAENQDIDGQRRVFPMPPDDHPDPVRDVWIDIGADEAAVDAFSGPSLGNPFWGWNVVVDAHLQMQATTNLLIPVLWTNIGTVVTANQATLSIPYTNSDRMRGFRLIWVKP